MNQDTILQMEEKLLHNNQLLFNKEIEFPMFKLSLNFKLITHK